MSFPLKELAFIFFGVVVAIDLPAQSTDWPQWRGPNRDGYAAPQSLLQSWTDTPPKMKWTFRDAGVGYSEAAIVDGRLITMGEKPGANDQTQCFAICLDFASGKMLWQTPIARGSQDEDYLRKWGSGPRGTPTVVQGRAFMLTDTGTLACVEIADGKLVWSVDVVKQLGGKIPKWGYSESPLVEGSTVYVTPGESNFIVGFDMTTGKQTWGSQGANHPAQYVSMMKHQVQGVPMLVTATTTGLLGFHATSGKLLWSNPSTGNPTAVIPTPIISEGHVYHTSDYGAGNVKLKLSANGQEVQAEEVYFESTKSMQNHHGGVVLMDNVIYGFSKIGRGVWMAQDYLTGEVLWTEERSGNRSGSIAAADGCLYCYNDTSGEILLVAPSREKLEVRGELKLPEQTKIPRGSGAIWAHPVIGKGTLVLRDQDLIFAFDIKR
jgi:outer membrane protein assembly factor BamB